MLWCMRTTIRLDDDLLHDAKRFAAESGRTLTALIEDALRELLARHERPKAQPRFKVKPLKMGGLRPGIDLNNSAELLDIMEANDEDA